MTPEESDALVEALNRLADELRRVSENLARSTARMIETLNRKDRS